MLLALLLGVVAVGCSSGGEGGYGGPDAAASDAADGSAGGGGFHINPSLCAAEAGLRSAIRSVPPTAAPLQLDRDEVAGLMLAEGYAGVTRTDDLGLNAGVAGRDERGDWAIVERTGALTVASSCAVAGLGQVHRLDEALARLANLVAPLTGESPVVVTRRWTWPTAVYEGGGGRYWRQAAGEGLDLNAPTDGALGIGAPAALGFVLAGASDPGTDAGDVVGIDELAVAGATVVEQDKRVVRGAAALRWPMPALEPGDEVTVRVDLTVADATLRWKVGAWLPYVEALFGSADGAGLSFSLQGSLPGAVKVSQPVSAAGLPAAITRVGAVD